MSIGSDGFKAIVKKFYTTEFTFEAMDLPLSLKQRGVDNTEKLPNYFYRDDGLRLWGAISEYCLNVLKIFYKNDEDVQMDSEIQAWIEDVHERGFPGLKPHQRQGLPRSFENVEELADTMTKILFSSTCQHSSTHSEALDMYGFLPLTPAMMRLPPPFRKRTVGREFIIKCLPDQSPEAYYGSLANVMQFHKPDEVLVRR
jgi:arachidonate 5-lipoxygenase